MQLIYGCFLRRHSEYNIDIELVEPTTDMGFFRDPILRFTYVLPCIWLYAHVLGIFCGHRYFTHPEVFYARPQQCLVGK